MIVCSCNVFSDADVRDCLSRSEAPRSAREVYGCLGCAPKCGRCADTIRNIMQIEQQGIDATQMSCCRHTEPQPEIA